jgi:hypothetical protein
MTSVEVQPVPVEVINHPEPKKYELRAAYRTVVLTATNPSAELAGYDPLRVCLKFTGHANAFVLSGNISQANDPANLINPLVNPNGRMIPAGATNVEYQAEGQNEIWASGGQYPTVIGYEILRKVPE